MAARMGKHSRMMKKLQPLDTQVSSVVDYNLLVQLIENLEHGANQLEIIKQLEGIFTEVLRRKEMHEKVIPLKPDGNNPVNVYKSWLQKTYNDSFSKIIQLINSPKTNVSQQAFISAMNLISWEGQYPIDDLPDGYFFPTQKLKLVVIALLSMEKLNTNLFNCLENYTCYKDVVYFLWKILPSLTPKVHPNEIYILNFFALLERLKFPPNESADTPEKLFCFIPRSNNFEFDVASAKRSLNRVWNCVMHWCHTSTTHKKLLLLLTQFILPHLDKPLLLTDFLMDSLDLGGSRSIIALQGIFELVNYHHLEYPDIFTKLYSLFEPEIFHMRSKKRLFFLSDIFLASTHIPETLVAAFVKRFARLALVAPQEDIVIICVFIKNLIIRHPGLKSLVDKSNTVAANCDPYIMEERDPMKTNAIFSSLWELESLQNHAVPSVAKAASFIHEPIPKVATDLSKILDKIGDSMFEKELTKYAQQIVLTFDKPKGMSLPKGEMVSNYWKL